MAFTACVLTVSDTSDANPLADKSGPLLVSRLIAAGFSIYETAIVADDVLRIQAKLCKWCDTSPATDLIITTGGTGFTARDITPDATKAIIEREAPGIVCALIGGSLKVTPMAMLSRLSAGIRKRTLIINFPGSAKACDECMTIVEPVLTHAIDQLKGNTGRTAVAHKQLQQQQPLKSKVELKAVGLRPRHSQFPMISMDTAIQTIITECLPIKDIEEISIERLDQLNGRILASDISAAVPLPPFRASIKDGYAVLTADGKGNRKVMSTAATAGQPVESVQLVSGNCMRISTGAPLPSGCDAVVQVEDTKIVDMTQTGDELVVSIDKEPKVGQDIRPIGCDIACDGKPVVNHLTQLGPIELGLLASIGVHTVSVFRRPVVAVLSTGDEIVNTGQELKAGQVWDSNRPILLSLLHRNCVQSVDLGIAVDNPNEVYNRMRSGLLAADVLITSGGVSMGERDVLKQVMVEDFGAIIHFGRVNVKPGKPVTFATCHLNGIKKYIFGLPGNPVSAFVTFNLFVKPLIDYLANRCLIGGDGVVDIKTYQNCQSVRLECADNVYPLDDRPEFVRAVISYGTANDGQPIARLTGNQRSSRLLSAKDANVLVLLPQKSESITCINSGDIVTAFLI